MLEPTEGVGVLVPAGVLEPADVLVTVGALTTAGVLATAGVLVTVGVLATVGVLLVGCDRERPPAPRPGRRLGCATRFTDVVPLTAPNPMPPARIEDAACV